MKRREFLKLSGAVGGTAVASPTLLSGCAHQPLPGEGEVVKTPTYCHICFWKCAGYVYQENGQPWKVKGHPEDLHSGGRFCTRGTGGIGMYEDPDRLRQPMLRVDGKDGQEFKPVSWDEAFEFIKGRMDSIEERHGKGRIALVKHHNEGAQHFHRVLAALGSHVEGHPSFAQCRGPRDVGFSITYGEGVGSPERTDMEHSRCIVLIGSHIGENLHNGQVQTFTQALESGAAVITVDPRFSVAASKSRHWLPIKPGTDVALLLTWMHVLIEEDLYDHDYVERYTSGFDKLREHVRGHTPEWAFLETGLDPDLIRTTAREMAAAAPATVVHPGRHVTWYGDDTQRSRAIAMLNALLGSWGRKGGFYYPEKVDLPEFPQPELPKSDHDWMKEIQPDLPVAPSAATQKILEACTGPEPKLNGLFVYSTNIPLTVPHGDRYMKEAAEALDLLVVVDTMPAEVTGYADVVLPECTYLERYDPLRNSPEREPSLALRMPAFEPRWDTRPAWWIGKKLAEKMGVGDYFPFEDYSEVLDWQLKQVGSSLEEMQRIGHKRFPRKGPMYLDDMEQVSFRTPSKRIELHSSLLEHYGYDPIPNYTPPDPPPEGFYHLIYGRAPAHTFGRTSNNPLLYELMPENAVWVNPLVASEWGLGNGDYTRLKNPDGSESNRVRVRVTERIRPDSVYIVHGFGHTAKKMRLAGGVGANDTALIHNVKTDPIMGGTGMRASFVTFVKETA